MTEQRRLAVLRAIVEGYVHSSEPVGSKAIADRYNLGVSSATIRNDMAILEEEGLIEAPHTSAGRIPTDRGYRAFVDDLDQLRSLSAPEKRAIQQLLSDNGDLEDLLERTVRTLAQLTRQVAVVQVPTSTQARVRHLELVSLAPHQVLVVLILDTGKAFQGSYDLGEEVSEAELSSMRDHFLELIRGEKITDLTPLLSHTETLMAPAISPGQQHLAAQQHLATILLTLANSARQEQVMVAGMANLARFPSDFPLSISPVLDALEEQMVILRLLADMEQGEADFVISIGRENTDKALTGTSVVASRYQQHSEAKLGVVGPIRMDYPHSMAAVHAVARYLARILAA